MTLPGMPPRPSNAIVWALTIVAVAILAAVVATTIFAGDQSEALISRLSIIIGAATPGILSLFKSEGNRAILNQVAHQTNGAMTGPLAQIAEDTAVIRENQNNVPTIAPEGGKHDA